MSFMAGDGQAEEWENSHGDGWAETLRATEPDPEEHTDRLAREMGEDQDRRE